MKIWLYRVTGNVFEIPKGWNLSGVEIDFYGDSHLAILSREV